MDLDSARRGERDRAPGAAARTYAQKSGYPGPLRSSAYQPVQPPLYFLVTAALAQAVPDTPSAMLYLSRLVSALFGAGTVYFCWAATRELTPQQPMWAV